MKFCGDYDETTKFFLEYLRTYQLRDECPYMVSENYISNNFLKSIAKVKFQAI
jgi:hypothetical protein